MDKDTRHDLKMRATVAALIAVAAAMLICRDPYMNPFVMFGIVIVVAVAIGGVLWKM